MNSKRLLENLYCASKIGITSKENEKILKDYYKVVLQDLEVLEIIKKHLTICGLSISCFIGGNPNVKETYEPKFNNLKEWLENE